MSDAQHEANAITCALDVDVPPVPEVDDRATWSACGALELSGRADGPPIAPVAPVAARVVAAGDVLRELTGRFGKTVDIDAPRLLTERASLLGLRRQGAVSPGGQTHLLPAADGWLAVSLARASDLELLPAWLGVEAPEEVAGAVSKLSADVAVARGQELGIPVAQLQGDADEQLDARGMVEPTTPFVVRRVGGTRARTGPPFVVDLSSLWAGPLCARLLGLAGARVTKVESSSRPDGARFGDPRFFALLHAGQMSLTFDFASRDGVARLRRLIDAADVVIEASRPRALEQLGIDPDEVLLANPGKTWISITGYGRTGPWSNRVAFGDDAAVAGGLVVADERGPMFCADAIADPATGLFAAVAASASLATGGGQHIDLSLREVARHLAR